MTVFLIFFLAALVMVPAQQQIGSSGFFAGVLAEVSWYGVDAPAFGTGLVIGGGDGISIGGRLLYAWESNGLNILELGVFIRSYTEGKDAVDGLFFQVNAGLVVVDGKHPSLPADKGSFTTGVDVGWRFLIGEFGAGRTWYIDPVIRVGYPYMFATGLSAGLRF